MLTSRAVAYLNVDSSVAGPGFYAAATPQLDELLREATKKVSNFHNNSRLLSDLLKVIWTAPIIVIQSNNPWWIHSIYTERYYFTFNV